jgi:hypothetical protein
MLDLGLSLWNAALGRVAIPAGDAGLFVVAANGWQSDTTFGVMATGQSYSLTPDATPKAVLTVSSPGYDTAGAATTIARNPVLTRSQLQAYPNQANATEVAVGSDVKVTMPMSDYVYSGDTVTQVAFLANAYGACNTKTLTSGITNSSTAAYPKVIADWAIPPKQLFSGDIDIEVVAFQQFGQSQLPVAAVIITGTPTTGSAVAKTCTYGKSTKADALPVYKATFNASTDFAANGNGNVTFTFTAYPWVGNSTATRDTSAASFPSITALAPLVMRTGTVTVQYAYVATTGNDGTGVVSTTAATASATPYLTLNAAMSGLFATNSGEMSGCILRVKAGTFLWDSTSPTGATRVAKNAWFIIEGDPADGAPKTNCIVQTSTTGYKFVFSSSDDSYICFRTLNLQIAATFQGFYRGTTTGTLWLDDVNFDNNLAASTAWTTGMLAMYATFCDGQAGNAAAKMFTLNSSNTKWALVRGCATNREIGGNCLLSTTIDASGITGTCFAFGDATNTRSSNLIVHNCRVNGFLGSVNPPFTIAQASTPARWLDIAVIQNLIIKAADANVPTLYAFGENVATDSENVLFDYNTVIGGNTPGQALRLNVHNDPTTIPTTAVSDQCNYVNFALKRSIMNAVYAKDDAFHGISESDTGAGFLIGGWSKRYAVGWSDIQYQVDLAALGGVTFRQEYLGRRAAENATTTFVNAGAGDYRPATNYPVIPSGAAYQALAFDLNGVARLTGGTGAAGALEIA